MPKVLRNKYKFLFLFSSFFVMFSMLAPLSHAIVVAPFVAVGAIHLVAWLIGIISLPVFFIVKTIKKTKLLKAVFITMVVLIIVGGGLFVALKLMKGSSSNNYVVNKPAAPSPPVPPELRDDDGVRYKDTYNDRVPGRPLPDNYVRTAPLPSVKTLAGVLFVFSLIGFVPTLLTLLAINHGRNLWSRGQLFLLGLCISLVLSALVLFVLLVRYFRAYIN